MTNETEVTDLEVHTLDSLCEELVSGRGVRYGENGDVIQFTSETTRSVFNWYLLNRQRWRGQNRKEDVESIVKQLSIEPPNYPQQKSLNDNLEKETWHLQKVRINEFGGVHRNEKLSEQPPVFEYECGAELSVFEGNNGAGKSSILSAICWCLTGEIYRSQKQPEDGAQEFDIWVSDDLVEENEIEKYQIAKITPIPSSEVVRGNKEKQLPINTWVELIFVSELSTKEVTIRRSIQRKKNGKKIFEVEPDFSELGLIPIAREIGTRITGQIPYIQLNEKNDLSSAVADLTGFSPLKDLVKHAQKSKSKLDRDLPNDRDKEIKELDASYEKESENLALHFKDHHEVFEKFVIPKSTDEQCKIKLEELTKEFAALQIKALEKAEDILGDDFKPDDQSQRNDLTENIGPAIAFLKFADESTNLKSLDRLISLENVSEEVRDELDTYLRELVLQLEEITSLASRKELTSRIRLYAKISAWIKEQGGDFQLSEECPICSTNIKDLSDPVTGNLILDEIKHFLENEKEHLEHSLEQWSLTSSRALQAKFGSVSVEVQNDLPEHPGDLIEKALVEELFRLKMFSGALAPLKTAVKELCKKYLSDMESFDEPAIPEVFESNLSEQNILRQTIKSVYRALEYGKWLRVQKPKVRLALESIIGNSETINSISADDFIIEESSSLIHRLLLVKNLVTNQEPLQIAIIQVKRLLDINQKRNALENFKNLYLKASIEIEKLFCLDELVNLQVSNVMQPLSENTIQLKEMMYKSAYVSAPRVKSTRVQDDASLVIHAEYSGTKAEAHHFCNSSDLRATLIALMFSFWKHLKESHSSLSLFLLDDIQELFDPTNKWRLAETISKMVKDEAKIILTTNDQEFAKSICRAAVDISVDHRQILPANANNQIIILNESISQIVQKRTHFEKNENDHQAAQDYLNALRIYLESSLSYFFDFPVNELPEKPTFSDYYSAVITRVNEGGDSFSGQVFLNLISEPSLQSNSEVYRLMNESHHQNAQKITYNEVYELRTELKKITKLVELAREEYERWIRREPPKVNSMTPSVNLDKYELNLNVPLLASLSASTGDRLTEGEIVAGEFYSPEWLNEHTIFFNKTDYMGFAAEPNTRLLVETSNSIPEDNSWVIAKYLDKYLVRRVISTPQHYDMLTLIVETNNPSKRCPPLHVKKSEVQLYRVVGVLLDKSPNYTRTSFDAIQDEGCKILNEVEKAFRVEGTSALPLALEGQILLGGKQLSPSDIVKCEGKIVGLATEEGNLLKRVGRQIGLPDGEHVRQFDSIGGLGESFILRTEEIEDDPYCDIPLIYTTTEILGVIYED